MEKELTSKQTEAKELIRYDLGYLFIFLKNTNNIKSNYVVSIMPYQSSIIDGAEAWIAAMNNASPGAIDNVHADDALLTSA